MPHSSSSHAAHVFAFGPFRLFVAERLLEKGDEKLTVGGRALDLLVALVERAGEVVSHKELTARVWPDVTVEEANLRVHIAALRRALGDDRGANRYISSVAGRGYCFVAPVNHGPPKEILSRVDVSPPLAPNNHLPMRLLEMVGRDDTERIISTQLITRRFLSIVGPGGVGKTTVAVSVAHTALEGFGGAVFFVDLSSLGDPTLIPGTIASALGCRLHLSDPLFSLLAFLRDKRILLVIDNCEHLKTAIATLAERLVAETSQVHILITSREALGAEGEHVHVLSSLEVPPENPDLTSIEALRFPAAQLFMKRASAAGYRLELSDLDASAVAEICRKLDGMALAIELAAGRAGSYGIRGTAELLEKRLGLAWKGRRTALPRHQTLNSTLDWSFKLLSAREQGVLCRLSVFIGSFTVQAACSVAGWGEEENGLLDAITSLEGKSLISATSVGETAQYRLLNITRNYALAKLRERGETDEARGKHAVWVCRNLQQKPRTQSELSEADLSELKPYLGDVRAALDWALSARGDHALGVELAAAAAPLLMRQSLLMECRIYSERALAAIGHHHLDSRTELVLQEMKAYSSMFSQGNTDDVRMALDRGLLLAYRLEEPNGQLNFLAGLNSFLYRAGDFRGALEVAQQAYIVAQAFNDSAGLVMSEWMLGVAHHCAGNQADAERHCQQGMIVSVQQAVFNPTFFGYDHRVRALVGLAGTLWLRGYPNRALSTAKQAIDEAAAQGQPISVCISLYTAQVFFRSGSIERARELAERLIEIAERYALAPYQSVGTAIRAELAIASGELESGIGSLRQAMSSLHLERHNILFTVFSGALADGLRKAGRFDEGIIVIDEAIDQAIKTGARFELAELLRLKADLLLGPGKAHRGNAIALLNDSLQIAREQSALAYELRSATTLARLLLEDGQKDTSKEVLRPIYDQFTEGLDTPDLQSARSLLRDLG